MTSRPNVVLVVMDTSRASDVFDATVAPTVAEIGSAGTTVPEAISPAPWTLPSHASMVTGTYPSKHGAHADHERLDEKLPTLAELFGAEGYETVCISNNTWLSRESGFDRGFDTFQQMWQLVQSERSLGELVDVTEQRRVTAVLRALLDGNPLANAANVLYRLLGRDQSDDGAERTTNWLTTWLGERNEQEPFFLLANYLEPHLEYRPPRRLAEQYLTDGHSYREAMDVPQKPFEYLAGHVDLDESDFRALQGLYRGEIAYIDEHIATLRQALVDAGEWKNTIFVVTADHGENIGDHGLMDHQYCLYDTLVHVPLVIHGGSFTDGGTISDLVSLVDLAPTLLDEVGIDAPHARAHFQGQSFHRTAENSPREYTISEYLAPQPSMDALERHVGDLPESVYEYDRSLRAIRTDEYKLVRGSDGLTELYDRTVDPHETANVAGVEPTVVEQLAGTLDEWLETFEQADTDEDVSIGDERKKQLEELGYLQ